MRAVRRVCMISDCGTAGYLAARSAAIVSPLAISSADMDATSCRIRSCCWAIASWKPPMIILVPVKAATIAMPVSQRPLALSRHAGCGRHWPGWRRRHSVDRGDPAIDRANLRLQLTDASHDRGEGGGCLVSRADNKAGFERGN